MTLPIYYYVLGTPLGVLGLVRWSCWLVRRIPAVLYRPVTNNFRLPISVVVPVYQEDPEVFAAAIDSWLRNRVAEVILVIDVSDRVCRSVASHYPVTVLITDVPGKRDALRTESGIGVGRTAQGNLLERNEIHANEQDGVRLVSEATQTDVRDNVIGDNSRYGVYIDGDGAFRLAANTIFGSRVGVLLKGRAQIPAGDNELRDNRDGDIKNG